jgi:Uma2 family endonuclease
MAKVYPAPPKDVEIITEDNETLESAWHRSEMNLLIDLVQHWWRHRDDFYVGGNMFIYYSDEVPPPVLGPDFFLVEGVDGSKEREAWLVWEEGKLPDLIVELLSPRTMREDLQVKKELYAKVFGTREYYCFDRKRRLLLGWRLEGEEYVSIEPNERGWLWSEVLGLWLGIWEGRFQRIDGVWLRFYTPDGELVPHPVEEALAMLEQERQRAEAEHQRAEIERQRAEAERQRAEQLERELQQLRRRLRRRNSETQ